LYTTFLKLLAMTDDSISQKLSELFDLFNSGALTQEEYESLKSKIINEVEAKPERERELKNEAEISEETELKESPPETQPGKIEKEVRSAKKPVIIALISFIIICLAALIIIFVKPGGARHDSGKKNRLTEARINDVDGNTYNTVTIGTQTWMTGNLKTTKYNDGSPISLVTDSAAWATLTAPAYCWYNNDESANKNPFGALYNWYAVETNKLCPAGWHVPTDEEWTVLEDFLMNNGYAYEGSGNDIAKSIAAASGWLANDTAGNVGNDQASNNKSGFTASQGGYRFSYGTFHYSGSYGKWWTSTESSKTSAMIRFIFSGSSIVNSYANQKRNGFSVRCLKDSGETQNNAVSDNSIITESVSDVWDEAFAKNLIMEELAKHKDWSGISSGFSEEDSLTLIHNVNFFPMFKFENEEIVLGIAYSDYEGNDWGDFSHGVLSAFEFRNRGGWRLINEGIAFAGSKSYGRIKWYRIASDNYAISISNYYGHMGEVNEETQLYAFINGGILPILNVSHMGNAETYYDLKFRQSNNLDNEGFYYFLVEERIKSADDDSDTIITRTTYAFNGSEYEQFDNTGTTDPSLTSISRFYDINTVQERENNVCPTCHGTGTQVCNLCGGTGVNNMGMECGCIRTYNMEIAAGHTPGHPPLQWTCPSCRGTGEYNR
jgi:uncharacterized protein (TIGR02145 family)